MRFFIYCKLTFKMRVRIASRNQSESGYLGSMKISVCVGGIDCWDKDESSQGISISAIIAIVVVAAGLMFLRLTNKLQLLPLL